MPVPKKFFTRIIRRARNLVRINEDVLTDIVNRYFANTIYFNYLNIHVRDFRPLFVPKWLSCCEYCPDRVIFRISRISQISRVSSGLERRFLLGIHASPVFVSVFKRCLLIVRGVRARLTIRRGCKSTRIPIVRRLELFRHCGRPSLTSFRFIRNGPTSRQ